MRKVIFGLLGMLLVGAPALAETNGACQTRGEEWRQAAFSSPAKPSQARVLGRAGHETSGPALQQMTQALRRCNVWQTGLAQ